MAKENAKIRSISLAETKENAKQVIKGTTIGGSVSQTSDVGNTSQQIENVEAKQDASQSVQTQPATLTVGKMKATGVISVVGLVIIVVAFLVIKYLT